MRLEVRILGPLEVTYDSRPVAVRGPKERALVVRLALDAGRVVSFERLVASIWDDEPPASADGSLRVLISRVRKALAQAGADAVLLTQPPGYLLVADEVDAARFELLARRGLAERAEGRDADAAATLTEALALWRGDRLCDIVSNELRAEADRLQEARLAALEARIDADLACGRHAEVLGELEALCRSHPLREGLWASRITALYRSDRQAEALAAYQDLRHVLAEGLGIDPSPRLRALEAAVLAQDPSLTSPATDDVVERAPPVGRDEELAPVPTAWTRPRFQTNLPLQPNPIVGRERELEQAGALLRHHRLLTLTGPGGSGKTRLALQLATDAIEHFPDGVFWVPLQALVDPALVERAIATSVGADADLVEHVATKRLLVLLDNFEQVIQAASAISSLLAATPNAAVLVTSREPLRIRSEQQFPVEPLRNEDAAVLFVERACAVAPGFRPTAAVGEICRRLDDLPLAIELAAARVALLDPDELLSRIERRLPLLTSSARDVPARQRTLRATIEWSYLLLEPDEQDLLRRLAVFIGSFSLEAAEAICGADLDTLEQLIVKNLLRRWGSGRIGMLDTIREYALERLEESPAVEDLRRRHAEFFLAVAESANLNSGKLLAGGQHLDIAIGEQDNLRGALSWTLARGSVALGLQIAVAMETFWVAQDPREGMRWFTAFLEHPEADAVETDLRAHALRSYGSAMYIAGDIEASLPVFQQSLALFEQLGDECGQAVLLHRLGLTAMRTGEPGRGRELVERSDVIHERNGDRWGLAQTRGTLGALAREAGEEARAFELMGQSAVLAREVGVRWWEGGVLAELSTLLINAGRLDEAERYARESLSMPEEVMDRAGRVFGVGLLACIAAERGQLERAGHLWGAIEDQDAVAPLGGWRRHRDAYEERILRVADPVFEVARVEGRALTIEGAAELAMAPVEAQPGGDTTGG